MDLCLLICKMRLTIKAGRREGYGRWCMWHRAKPGGRSGREGAALTAWLLLMSGGEGLRSLWAWFLLPSCFFSKGYPVGCVCVHRVGCELRFRWGGFATSQTELEDRVSGEPEVESKGDQDLCSQPVFIISAGHVLRVMVAGSDEWGTDTMLRTFELTPGFPGASQWLDSWLLHSLLRLRGPWGPHPTTHLGGLWLRDRKPSVEYIALTILGCLSFFPSFFNPYNKARILVLTFQGYPNNTSWKGLKF